MIIPIHSYPTLLHESRITTISAMTAIGLALVFTLNLNGCATITRGSSDTLVVESDPSGADVKLSNGLTGKTPSSFKLDRKANLVVTITKEGYEKVDVNVTPQVAGAGSAGMAGNILLGGLIGAAVDAGSGAMYDLKPNPVKVNLVKLPDSVKEAVGVTDRLNQLEGLFANGVISKKEYQMRRKEILSDL